MLSAAFLEDFRFLSLNAQLRLPDIEEFWVACSQVGYDVRPSLGVEAGVALADLTDDYPGFSFHLVRDWGIGIHGLDRGQLETNRAEVVVPAMINIGLGF